MDQYRIKKGFNKKPYSLRTVYLAPALQSYE